MISAVADSCSVRLDKVNRKVYKFHALVFNEDCQGNNKEEYLYKETEPKACEVPCATRGILSQQPKTEWKFAHNGLLSGLKELPKQPESESPLAPRRKKSRTSEELSKELETFRTERQKVRFKETEECSQEETEACRSCLHALAVDTTEYDKLMEKPKEELVSMIMDMNLSLQNRRRRKTGYIPTEKDITTLKQLESSTSETKTKTKPSRTRRRYFRSKRLTSF